MKLKLNLYAVSVFISVFFLQGCSISKNVVPVDSSKEISKIYVLKNDEVLMDDFHPKILKQLNELGFASESYSGSLPKAAIHYMNYTANWRWDLAMYLFYFKATLYEQGKESGFSKVLGEVEYDAKNGGGSLSKFGEDGDKIRPLLKALFAKVKRINTTSYKPVNNNTVALKSYPVTTEKIITETKTASPIVATKKTTEKSQASLNQIQKIQTALQAKDYYSGEINGTLDRQTAAAISLYKEAHNLPGDSVDKAFLRSLGIE